MKYVILLSDDLGTADFITEEEKKLSGTTVIILIAFCVLPCHDDRHRRGLHEKKTSSSEDYFLGGRGLNGWVAALSAQASDMSGWLLMGLPGHLFLWIGQIWIAVGLLSELFSTGYVFQKEDFVNTPSQQTIP